MLLTPRCGSVTFLRAAAAAAAAMAEKETANTCLCSLGGMAHTRALNFWGHFRLKTPDNGDAGKGEPAVWVEIAGTTQNAANTMPKATDEIKFHLTWARPATFRHSSSLALPPLAEEREFG